MTINTLYTSRELEEIKENSVPNWHAKNTERCRITRGEYFRELVTEHKLPEALIREFKRYKQKEIKPEELTEVQDLANLFGVGTTLISRYLAETIPKEILQKRRYVRIKASTAAAGRQGGCVERWKPLPKRKK